MPSIANPTLLAIGVAVFVLGLLLRRWSNRHSLTDQLTDAAWEAVKARDAASSAARCRASSTTSTVLAATSARPRPWPATVFATPSRKSSASPD